MCLFESHTVDGETTLWCDATLQWFTTVPTYCSHLYDFIFPSLVWYACAVLIFSEIMLGSIDMPKCVQDLV